MIFCHVYADNANVCVTDTAYVCLLASLYVCIVCVCMDDCLYGDPFMKWMHPTVCPHVSCLCASSDHEFVDGYRVQIVYALPLHTCQTMSCKNCRARLGNAFTILHDVVFDNKVS